MLEKFNGSPIHPETMKIKLRNKLFKETGAVHLVNIEDSLELLCERCHFSMCVMSEESFMVCQNCSYMHSMDFNVTPRRRAEINIENQHIHTKEEITVSTN